MNGNWKKILTLLLAAAMLLSLLSGCGGRNAEGKTDDKNNEDTPEYVYLPDYVELSEDIGRVEQTFAVGDKLYCISWMVVGTIKELYPKDSSVNPWYFSIDGEEVSASRIDDYSIYDYASSVVTGSDLVTTEVFEKAVSDTYIPAADSIEPVPVDTVMDADTYASEQQAAIDTYVQYDAAGELIVPEGYEFYEYDKTEQALLRMELDGSNATRLENYALLDMGEGVSTDGNVNRIVSDAEGNIWVVENVYGYISDEDGYQDMGESYFLRQIDETGAELQRRDLGKLKESFGEDEYFYINNVLLDAEGNTYVLCDSRIFVLDTENNVSFSVETDNWINSLFLLGDGRVCAFLYEDDGQKLKLVDTAAKAWGKSYDVTGNFYDAISGNEEYDLYYNDGMNFYGYKLETGESTVIVNWLNANINGNQVGSIVPLQDGRIVVMIYNWNSRRANTEMAILSKQPYSVLGDKTVLTLACMYDYNIRDAVIAFNKKSDTCRIEVKSYEQYNDYDSEDESQWNAGVTKLNTEIISGDVPDILLLDGNLPGRQYMSQGLLEPLDSYLDNDPEVSRADLMESVLDAVSFNGALYQTVSTFNVMTVVCPSALVQGMKGWTVGEMRNILSRMPEGSDLFQNSTREDVLNIFMYYGSSYVDWETGKCSFNSDSFVDLLEYAASFPEEIDWDDADMRWESEYTRLQKGTLLGSTLYLYNMENFLQTKTLFDGKMTVMGYPCETRDGTMLSINSGLAMSSSCKDKDAAWEFLRTAFLPTGNENGYYDGLPINREDMDAMIAHYTEKTYEKDENGKPVLQPISTWWECDDTGEMHEVKIMPAEQEDVDQFFAIIESATKVADNNDTITDMVMEEAQALFAGQKSARDVANIIQSKVQTYVNEHM